MCNPNENLEWTFFAEMDRLTLIIKLKQKLS